MKKIALIGNPNVGKTTLFNTLTGLNQKTGNYPGITVEKKHGTVKHNGEVYKLYDFPGIYSIYPTSADEEIVSKILLDSNNEDAPDLAIFVIDSNNLKRGILLFQQIKALGINTIFVINALNEKVENLEILKNKIEEYLQSKVLIINVKSSTDTKIIKEHFNYEADLEYVDSFNIPNDLKTSVKSISEKLNCSEYKAWYLLSSTKQYLNNDDQDFISKIRSEHKIVPKRLQVKESIYRNRDINSKLGESLNSETDKEDFNNKLDYWLTHPIFGYIIFFGLLFLMFQAIYSWAETPMDLIEGSILDLSSWVKTMLPKGPINSIITDGIIAGLAGIFVFIPQIAILFLFISIMESTGYMSRVVFLMDRWMKPFGLSGKSVVPFISGVACAIPAIMSARNIENQKERLITILVTPFTTCSARIPIYTIIIALVIPDISIAYFFNLKGITLFLLYLLGFISALGGAWILKKVLKSKYKSYLILELPKYQFPIWRDVLNNVVEKTWSFIWGAGRIILAVSIILWALGSFGFGESYNNVEEIVRENNSNENEETIENMIAAEQLEHSILGNLGKAVEPVFAPLGMDWKMGVGVLSSFAAREVFVGTMSTLYSLGGTDEENTVLERMKKETDKEGNPLYNWVVGISILIFYAFAMQCMSTLAIVKQETNSWKWPIVQFVFMGALAYFSALIFYQTFS